MEIVRSVLLILKIVLSLIGLPTNIHGDAFHNSKVCLLRQKGMPSI